MLVMKLGGRTQKEANISDIISQRKHCRQTAGSIIRVVTEKSMTCYERGQFWHMRCHVGAGREPFSYGPPTL